MITNILTYLEYSALQWADKIAIADDKNNLTFLQWNQYSRNIGTAISYASGGALRKPVLVFVDRRIEGLVGFMGVTQSGNFYVPIDCKMPDQRVKLISDVLDIVYTNTLREEEGGTYSPTTSASMNPLTNEWFVLYLFTTSKDAKDNLCKRAHEEFLKLLANGANEVDFNKVRDAALNQYSINSQKNEYWMGGIRSYVRGWDVISEHEKVLKEITLKDFNDFMKNLYNGDNRIQVIMNGVEIAK